MMFPGSPFGMMPPPFMPFGMMPPPFFHATGTPNLAALSAAELAAMEGIEAANVSHILFLIFF